ncbi:hypothetical protein LINPERHAP2_LOCUS36967 [Linum perenne]
MNSAIERGLSQVTVLCRGIDGCCVFPNVVFFESLNTQWRILGLLEIWVVVNQF